MKDDPTSIKFDFESWKIRVKNKRKNRMKITVNLNQEESVGWKNFAQICKPDDIPQEQFMKAVFLAGVEALNKDLAEMVKKYAKENKEELAASGITVIEGDDGDVQLADSTTLSGDAGVERETKRKHTK